MDISKKSAIFIVIISAILGLATFGYFKATPGLKNQTKNEAKIEITPKSFNFGKVNFGERAEFAFKVENIGNKILEIKRVSTSCACTTAKINKEKIAPKETAELLVSYDTAAMGSGPHGKGKQERIIYVKSNDPLNPQVEVMIYAYVQ